MHPTQERFLRLLDANTSILDFGCGSGRDTKYFLEKGYQVTATDGAAELCRLASEFTGIKVKEMLFQELDAWITSDVRPGRGEEKWLNLILRKNQR